MSSHNFGFLRPYLSLSSRSRRCSSYEHLYDAWRNSGHRCNSSLAANTSHPNVSGDYQRRIKKLEKAQDFSRFYPRLERGQSVQQKSPKDIRAEYSGLAKGEVVDNVVTVNGTPPES